MPIPTYSHGGPPQPGFPSVAGTSQTSGRPVSIVQAINDAAMQIFFSGTSCTVVLEGNGGAITNGAPPANEWVDYSAGGYALTNGQALSKFLPASIPYWRTRISAITLGGGTGLTSYVPDIVGPSGVIVSASYPKLDSGPQSYT